MTKKISEESRAITIPSPPNKRYALQITKEMWPYDIVKKIDCTYKMKVFDMDTLETIPYSQDEGYFQLVAALWFLLDEQEITDEDEDE